jgi:hypothetical protein
LDSHHFVSPDEIDDFPEKLESHPSSSSSSSASSADSPASKAASPVSKTVYVQKLARPYLTSEALRLFRTVWVPNYQRHYFGFTKQYAQRKAIEESLKPGRTSMLLDYSKAYECTAYNLIQSGFFSSAKVGILPVCIKFHDGQQIKQIIIYFLSDTLENDPACTHAALRYAITFLNTLVSTPITHVYVFSVSYNICV